MKDSQKMLLQIKGSVRRLYDAQKEKKKFDAYYDAVRKKEQVAISNFMFTNLPSDESSFEITLDEGETYYTSHVKLRITRVRNKKVVWFLEKIKKKLDKKIYNKIVDKTYTINNMPGLIEHLRSCGVDPKRFKTFVDVDEQINEQKLNTCYDTGKIKKSELEGCYKVEIGDPYIRITELNK